jgi:hypothetical protein
LGFRLRWIDAFMYERSPSTASDFVRQRAHWLLAAFHCPGATAEQGSLPVLHALSWCCMLVLIATRAFTLFFCDTDPHFGLALAGLSEIFRLRYAVGCILNFSPFAHGGPNDGSEGSVARWLVLFCMCVTLLLPLIGFLELCGLLLGMFQALTGRRDYDVVRERVQRDRSCERRREEWPSPETFLLGKGALVLAAGVACEKKEEHEEEDEQKQQQQQQQQQQTPPAPGPAATAPAAGRCNPPSERSESFVSLRDSSQEDGEAIEDVWSVTAFSSSDPGESDGIYRSQYTDLGY